MEATRDLIQGAIDGIPGAFEELMERAYDEILFIAVYLSNEDDGKDIAQEAVIKMHGQIHNLKRPENFKAWANKVIRSCYADYIGKQKLDKRGYADLYRDEAADFLFETQRNFLPTEFLEDREYVRTAMEIIKEFPENQKMAMLYFYRYQMSYEEIARALDLSLKQVDNALQKARKKLKARLKERSTTTPEFAVVPVGVSTAICQMLGRSKMTAAVADICGSIGGVIQLPVISLSVFVYAAMHAIALAMVVLGVVVCICFWAEWRDAARASPPPSQPPENYLGVHRVSDMIGEECSGMLERMVCRGANAKAWHSFLQQLSTGFVIRVQEIDGVIYTGYRLKKQDKRLVLMSKRRVGSEAMTVCYFYVGQQRLFPQKKEILRMLA